MDDLFSEQAAGYAEFRPVYPESLYQFIFKHVKQKRYALDCGTGSGQVAGRLAGDFTRVYATDISRNQFEYAPKKENITYLHRPAEDTTLPPGYFDLVTAAQSIHWFDLNKFYKEVRRVTAEGGLLSVFGYGRIEINSRLDPLIHRFYEEVFGEEFKSIRNHINNRYRTIPFPFDEIPAPDFEINLEWTLNDLEGFFNTWSAVQKMKRGKNINPVDDIMMKIKSHIQPSDIFRIGFPVFLRAGIVHN